MEQNFDHIDELCNELSTRYTNYVIDYIAIHSAAPAEVPGFEEDLKTIREIAESFGITEFSLEDMKDSLETFLLVAQFVEDETPEDQNDAEMFLNDVVMDLELEELAPEDEQLEVNGEVTDAQAGVENIEMQSD